MGSSRRYFLAGVGRLWPGGLLSAPNGLATQDRKGTGQAKPKGKPTMSMVVETVFTEGLAQLSYLIGDKATGKAAVIDHRGDGDVDEYV